MYAFWKVEWKAAGKSLLLWSAVVGGIGLICILLYQSMEGSMAGMAENFASMGAFSEAFGIFRNGDRHDTCAWKQYVCGNTGDGDPVERGRWTHGGIYLYPAGCAGEDHHCEIRGGDRKSCAFYDFLRGMLSDWFFCTWRKRNYRGIPPFYGIAAYDEYRDCVHLFPDFGGQ